MKLKELWLDEWSVEPWNRYDADSIFSYFVVDVNENELCQIVCGEITPTEEERRTEDLANAIAKLPEAVKLLFETSVAIGTSINYMHGEEIDEILRPQLKRVQEFLNKELGT